MLVRLILWAVFGFVLYTIIQAARSGMRSGSPPKPADKTPGGEEMVRDPLCGTYVPRSEALFATVGEQYYGFCSSRCRDEFLQRHR